VTITIRTSRDLHRWLIAQAKKNKRSLNHQIEWLLTQSREVDEARPLLDELRKLLAEARKK
jgi:predicted HicB family RNase H-like nuclease